MSGVKLLAAVSAALALMCGVLLASAGTDAEGLGVVVRATARTSLVLFLAAYVASPLRSLQRSEWTKWLLRNRRYLGLSYAVSHTLHLAGIVALARMSPDFHVDAETIVGGGGAYVLLYLMALTSNDRAVAALGIERWRRLHRVGMHYNWFIFFQSFAHRAATGAPLYVALLGLLVGAAALRFVTWRRRVRTPSAISRDEATRRAL